MANFSNTMKVLLSRGAKCVGVTAGQIAKATKFKTNELSGLGKRRELVSELGAKVYELSQNGFVLPEEAAALVQQIATLDSELAALRADHASQKEAYAQQRANEKASRAAEKAAAKADAAVKKGSTPVQTYVFEPEMPVAEMPAEGEVPSAPVAPTLEVEETSDPSEKPAGDVPNLHV